MRLASLALILLIAPALADEPGWEELAGPNGLKAWKTPTGDWADAGSVRQDPSNPKRLAYEAGSGILVNGKVGRTTNLLSSENFGDVEAHVEFMIPRGSNAGVK